MWDGGRRIKLDLVDEDLGWMERRTRQHLKIEKGAPYSSSMHVGRFCYLFIDSQCFK